MVPSRCRYDAISSPLLPSPLLPFFLTPFYLPTPAWEPPLQAAHTPWAACTTRCAALACESHSAPTPCSAAPPKTWRTNETPSASERAHRVTRARLGRDHHPPPLCLRHQPPLWHLENERTSERTSERTNERVSERVWACRASSTVPTFFVISGGNTTWRYSYTSS